MLTVNVVVLQPLVALISCLSILIIPRLLNFIVALYLILIGVIRLRRPAALSAPGIDSMKPHLSPGSGASPWPGVIASAAKQSPGGTHLTRGRLLRCARNDMLPDKSCSMETLC